MYEEPWTATRSTGWARVVGNGRLLITGDGRDDHVQIMGLPMDTTEPRPIVRIHLADLTDLLTVLTLARGIPVEERP